MGFATENVERKGVGFEGNRVNRKNPITSIKERILE